MERNELKYIDIFIPSYHRWDNLKTAKFYVKNGWPREKIHVFVDSETDDIADYERMSDEIGYTLHIFDMEEARKRFDYVHRASKSRRSAGQARNMFYDFAEKLGIKEYIAQDDDTQNYQVKRNGKYRGMATANDIKTTFYNVIEFMKKRKIGLFGLSQTGDFFGGVNKKLLRNKVMNTTFVLTDYIYRGERGVQDDDTSQFTGVMNEGYFTGSLGDGLVLQQVQSATAKGGLTDLYNECKLLNKALVCPIQFPSAIIANKQSENGGRLHHRISIRYLYPKLLKSRTVDNIAWNTYPEDGKFTNEAKRNNV